MPSDIHSKDNQLYNVQDLIEWKAPPTRSIISDGVLNIGSRLQLFGDEGTWKSALAIHAAFCIATGRRWLGFYTNPANILYIQGEMTLGETKIRIEKYCLGSKNIFIASIPVTNSTAPASIAVAPSTDSYAYPTNVIIKGIEFYHLDEQSGIGSLRKTVELVLSSLPNLPLVIVIDPLYKMFRRNLLDEKDVKYFTDNIDQMRHDYPTTAYIIVHHSRKASMDAEGNILQQGSSDMFGSAELKWWADTIMRTDLDITDETRTIVNITFSKHSRVAAGYLPHLIRARWDKNTLHPHILARLQPKNPEDELDDRGDDLLKKLE